MRELNIGTKKYTKVSAMDKAGHGHANHIYEVHSIDRAGDIAKMDTRICFQNGPIKEHGVNGVMNEDLLVIVIDRLKCFQCSEYRCKDNALALAKLEEALGHLNHRTTEREQRGVEGTHVV